MGVRFPGFPDGLHSEGSAQGWEDHDTVPQLPDFTKPDQPARMIVLELLSSLGTIAPTLEVKAETQYMAAL